MRDPERTRRVPLQVAFRDKWIRPLHTSGDPIRTVIAIVRQTSVRIEDVRCGCP